MHLEFPVDRIDVVVRYPVSSGQRRPIQFANVQNLSIVFGRIHINSVVNKAIFTDKRRRTQRNQNGKGGSRLKDLFVHAI